MNVHFPLSDIPESTQAMSVFNAMPQGAEVEPASVVPILLAGYRPDITPAWVLAGMQACKREGFIKQYGDKFWREPNTRLTRPSESIGMPQLVRVG